MSEPKAGEAATPQPLSVKAKVYPSKKEGNVLAFAKVTLGGCFAVKNIRVMNSEKGLFVAMPDRQDAKGEYRDICFPTTAEMRKSMDSAVLGEYQRVMELLTERGTKAKTSVQDALKREPKKTAPTQEAAGPTKQRKTDKGAR